MAYSFSDFTRSRGVKLTTIFFLILLMGIPMIFVSLVSYDRQGRADEVTHEVSQRYGGKQYIVGPYLSIPYRITSAKNEVVESGDYVIFPENGQARFDDVNIDIRTRSLFKVPVFEAKGILQASFSPPDKQTLLEHYQLNWSQARLLVGVSDGRGLRDEVYLIDKNAPDNKGSDNNEAGKPVKFEPAGQRRSALNIWDESGDLNGKMGPAPIINPSDGYTAYNSYEARGNGTFLSVPAGEMVSRDNGFDIEVSLNLGGAQELGVYPFAKTTKLEMSSGWPTPGFQGGFAPAARDITPEGFKAQWTVPYLARGILGQGPAHTLSYFSPENNAMSVQFVSEVSPYQTVNRALKYSILFIGLVFLVFFLFEILLGKRVHPAQYLLIGLAQCVFYLLLLAFSEKIGFSGAYIIAAGATIALTSLYAAAVFGGKQYAGQSAVVFTLTYGLLYVLMQRSDYALLLGSVTAFAAIALTMFLTRNMNWYGGEEDAAAP